ncbi:MAG: flap endonuclease [Cocleimonas sp.]|nr:flap endonuclease [Cocleimonas sp.]
MKTAWLIDSSIYVFKAWHTRPSDLTDIHGKPINAVLGFIDFAYRLLSYEKPELIAFAFDESLQTSHRKEIYPEYKANRSPAPESLKYQFQLCRAFVRALGIHEGASLHYEADDLIGTWAKTLREHGIANNIITADKDLAQLIHANDHWWEYERGEPFDTKKITKRFRAKPRQIADQLAIAGDKSDNIPGVPGIGMSTAGKLLRRFDNLENLFASIPEISTMQIRGAARIQDLIEEHQDTILLSRKLTGIQCEIEDVDIKQFTVRESSEDDFLSLCEQLCLSDKRQHEWLQLRKGILVNS